MEQRIVGIICNVFAFLLFEYYMEYANDKYQFSIRYGIYGIYVVQFLLCYFFVMENYLISPLFFGILLLRRYSGDVPLCLAFLLSEAVQIWIFSGFASEVLLYNLFVGGALCLMPVTSSGEGKRSLLWHGFSLLYSMLVVVVCDFGFWGATTFSRLLTVVLVYFVSLLLSLVGNFLLEQGLNFFFEKIIWRYVKEDTPLMKRWREQEPNSYAQSQQISALAQAVAGQLRADIMVAAVAGRYYNVGILNGKADYENCCQIRREYHLPKYLEGIWKDQYFKQRIPATKESAVVAFCAMAVAMLEYARRTGKTGMGIPEMVAKLMQNQFKKGKWNRCGFTVEELLVLEQGVAQWLWEQSETRKEQNLDG